ncbi:MAG: dynamin family protein, partial [Bacteroidales bacterium]|nr:dynamin family protein [Bacteroidales bacterium]
MKDNMEKIFYEIEAINRAIGTPYTSKPLNDLLNRKENTVFVAVLGQFKSGKSSLINSILGENILPLGAVPVTAIVTRLCYGKQPRIIVQFQQNNEIVSNIS